MGGTRRRVSRGPEVPTHTGSRRTQRGASDPDRGIRRRRREPTPDNTGEVKTDRGKRPEGKYWDEIDPRPSVDTPDTAGQERTLKRRQPQENSSPLRKRKRRRTEFYVEKDWTGVSSKIRLGLLDDERETSFLTDMNLLRSVRSGVRGVSLCIYPKKERVLQDQVWYGGRSWVCFNGPLVV